MNPLFRHFATCTALFGLLTAASLPAADPTKTDTATKKDAAKADVPKKGRTKKDAADKNPAEQSESSSDSATDKPTIAPEQAADYLNKEVIVEMTIAGSNNRDDKSPCFLNSKKDHRDEKNFTAIIFPDGLKKFKASKINEPAIHFFNKKVRVTGTIELHKERPQIKITDPKQIVIVEEAE